MGCKALKSLAGLENIKTVTNAVDIADNDVLGDVSALASITSIGSAFFFYGNKAATTLRLTSLERVGDVFNIGAGDLMTEVSAPKLTTTADFSLDGFDDKITTLSLPALNHVRGAMYVLMATTSLDGISALERIDGDLGLMSGVIPQATLDAWAAKVKGRRGIGGTVQSSSLL
jgi:hypothetical protein